jgi:hypothetical protein
MRRKSPYVGPILILGLNHLIETIVFGILYSYFLLYAMSLGLGPSEQDSYGDSIFC